MLKTWILFGMWFLNCKKSDTIETIQFTRMTSYLKLCSLSIQVKSSCTPRTTFPSRPTSKETSLVKEKSSQIFPESVQLGHMSWRTFCIPYLVSQSTSFWESTHSSKGSYSSNPSKPHRGCLRNSRRCLFKGMLCME